MVKLVHGISLNIIGYVNVGLHGFIITVSCPFHDDARWDSSGEGVDDECSSSGMSSDQLPFLCDLINSFVSFVGGRSNLFVDFSQLAEFFKTPYCWVMPALSCAAICPFLVTVLATEGANILKFARAVPQKGSFTAQHTILCTSSAHHLHTILCSPPSVILNGVKDLHPAVPDDDWDNIETCANHCKDKIYVKMSVFS